jgi:phosphate transport system substrate-binding protein
MCWRGVRAAELRTTLLALVVVVATVMGQVPARAAAPYVPVVGSGSAGDQNLVDQWRAAVASADGVAVTYSGVGSTSGRRDFIQGSVDFAVSELPFQAHPDDGSAAEVPAQAYAYLPLVAGGLSFMYNLSIGGAQVTDLRLSGETITKIFKGDITNWNDPAVQADNPGLLMPDKLLTPVTRRDCSGTSAQLTAWMSAQFPSLWATGTTACYPTTVAGAKVMAGSDGVSGYVAQSYGEGAITYVEKSYALKAGFPVAKVLNAAGFYVAPTASAVAIALTQAQLNADLTQNLEGVYTSPDPRAYPLSAYSYMIVPTDVAGGFTADKGNTLAAFARYAVCAGQQQADQLGYSPLPRNLVLAASEQVQLIPGAGGGIDLASCANPTFASGDSASDTLLTRTAPLPLACDQQGFSCGPTGLIYVAVTATASSSTPTAGTAVTLTAHLNPGSANGNVAFLDNGATLGTTTASGGVASLTASAVATGSHTITAVYSGDATHGGSTSPAITVTVAAGGGSGPGATGGTGAGSTGQVVASDGQFTLIAPDSTSPAILSNATLDDAGRSVAKGTLGQFTVVDERAASKKGWELSVTVDDFVNGYTIVPGTALGIKPTVPLANANSGPGVPTLGTEKLAGDATSGWTFAQLDAGQYDSAASFDADLTFVAPAGTAAGTYTSRITITLVSK